ncbi:MAG: metallophosphoesterase [Mariprofundaceae bacterium]|nr:metallophosphoesterase [Mariprofundaceae bacterium]
MLHILQLTDLHLSSKAPQDPFDLNPSTCLTHVLKNSLASTPEATLMLLTGDLVHDDVLAYQQVIDNFNHVSIPILHVSGNHDLEHERQKQLCHFPFLSQKVWRNEHWQVIMVKSSIDGIVNGEISAQEMAFVTQQLKACPQLFTLIATHHHPLDVGSAWLDKIGITNGHDFIETLSIFPKVKGITFGHVHQAVDQEIDGIRFLGCPSTNRQFKPNSDEFSLDDRPLAYRQIHLHDDGSIESHVVWVELEKKQCKNIVFFP